MGGDMIDDKHIRYRFVGYVQGLPHYEIVDEEKDRPAYQKNSNKPILGTKGDKHDERE